MCVLVHYNKYIFFLSKNSLIQSLFLSVTNGARDYFGTSWLVVEVPQSMLKKFMYIIL